MPLIKSSSKQARQKNIETEISAGKPPEQAVAIGYAQQRRAAAAGKALGGPIEEGLSLHKRLAMGHRPDQRFSGTGPIIKPPRLPSATVEVRKTVTVPKPALKKGGSSW